MRVFQEHQEENGYSRQEELTFWDCDRNEEMRLAAILSRAAIYAGYDYDARGLDHKRLLDMREVFLLSRMALRIHRRPRFMDVLETSTWENGIRGAHMQRVYEMRDQEGRLCVSARSEWILVDPESRKILRPNSFTARTIGVFDREVDSPEPKKLRLPREGTAELGTRRIVWSDLDGNGHLFSGNYGDIFWDYLPPELQDRTPAEFYINYNKEATLGDELRLVGAREGDVYRMEGVGASGPCFTAECVF